MNTQDRIAAALERIADALDKRNQPVALNKFITTLDAPGDEIQERLKAALPELQGRQLTMDEILSACGIKQATKGQRLAMGFAVARCGFRQRRTASQRFYVAPGSAQ